MKKRAFLYGAVSVFIYAGNAFAQAAQETAGQTAPTVMFSSEIDNARKLIDMAVEFFVKYSFQVIGGIVIFVLGVLAANFAAKFLTDTMKKRNLDVTITKFLAGMVKLCVIGFAALIALGKFGITIAPFIAGLSVVGFGTSFALQGPLSNYAAGASLIFTKPFKVGDIIEVAGVMGEVEDLKLARTILKTVDGTTIVIPNKHIIGEVIHNYSDMKKLNIKVGISYSSDIDKAVKTVQDIIEADKRIADSPKPKVGISEFADSAIQIYARIWCRQEEFWDVKFAVNKAIYEGFKENNIHIPFPQRDVHLIKEDA